MINRVLVAGGGTGGHLFPGIAVVEELRRRLPDLDVLFVGTEKGIEARVLPKQGERFFPVDVKPLAGRGKLELTRNLMSLPRSGLLAMGAVRSFRPDLVIGLGGYAAGPLVMAASAMRIPCALLEQNAHVGMTNRLLSRVVGRAYLTYEETAGQFGEVRARVLGNPVRRSFVEAARLAAHDPEGGSARARGLLILGGSLGARSLNEQVPQALAQAGLKDLGTPVVHQTGTDMVEAVQQRYRELGLEAEVVPFIEDMARAYNAASLVIGRAGATTLAELCAIGRASILVPYPHAAQDHQAKNAVALERAGAAIAIREENLSAEGLAGHVRTLLTDRQARQVMADAARRRGRPDAAAAVVDDLLGWLGVPTEAAPTPDEGGGAESDEPAAVEPSDVPPGLLTAPPRRRRAKLKRSELRLRTVQQAHEVPAEAVR